MSGQSANLSLAEARKMQVAIQHPSSNEKVSGGPGPGKGKGDDLCGKIKHQGKG